MGRRVGANLCRHENVVDLKTYDQKLIRRYCADCGRDLR
jgi:hypothetical protein